jgi:hypothetical protein
VSDKRSKQRVDEESSLPDGKIRERKREKRKR